MKTLKTLMEKRKNPLKNPTLNAYQQLEKYSKRRDVFISFTDIPKLGINPKNEYNTPTGVYTYPLYQVWDEMSRGETTHFETFGSGRPFIQVMEQRGSKFIENISKTYSFADLDKDMDKLRKYYPDPATNRKAETEHVKMQNLFIGMILDIQRQIEQTYKKTFEPLTNKKGNRPEINIALNSGQELYDSFMERIDVILKYSEKAIWEEEDIEWIRGLTRELTGMLNNASYTFMKVQPDEDGEDEAFKMISPIRSMIVDAKKILISVYNDKYIDGAKDGGIEWSIEHGKQAPNHYSAGGLLWSVTRLVANKNSEYDPDGKATSRWNGIFRKLGYVGVADRAGAGIIHPAEATQAVFFSVKGFKHIDMILNKQHLKGNEIKTIQDFHDQMWVGKPSGQERWNFGNYLHVLKNYNKDMIITNRRDFLKKLAKEAAENFKRYYEYSPSNGIDILLLILYYGEYKQVKDKKLFRQEIKSLAIEIKQGFALKNAATLPPLGIRMSDQQFLKAVGKLKK